MTSYLRMERPFEIKSVFSLDKIKKDRRLITFSICLIIATALWFLNALSKDYTTNLSYPVKYINPPKNRFLANNPPSEFNVKIEAHGFTLLRHKMAFSFSPILINLTTVKQNMEENSNSKSFAVLTENLIDQISGQVSKEIKILDISPQVITLVLDSLKTKTVKVLPVVEIDLMPQFFMTDSVILDPSEIDIEGPAATLDTILLLYTEPQSFDEVNTSIQQIVRVVSPENTKLLKDKVTMFIQVAKFTEKEVKVPVKALNIPEGYRIRLFPSEVKISFLVNLRDYETITNDHFEAFVDYSSNNNGKETLEVSLQSEPDGIKNVRIIPEKVEYLLEKY